MESMRLLLVTVAELAKPVTESVTAVMNITGGIVGVLCIYLVIKFSTASDAQKRTNVKNQMLYAITATFVMTIFLVLWNTLLKKTFTENLERNAGSGKFALQLLAVLGYATNIFGSLVILYALYLGYIMITASDAAKQAEAKKRIINALSVVVILVVLCVMLAAIGART